ncbi:hypothetical protein EV13_2074 [Prochlorococcus sp. MIT 0702]|nr:hypothetical protein EV13_2074 [Prochlorococcus sp. MIT 0702]KGG27732.1 hypothetical protein EV12_1163 [Prochlorococcus sp. MIT 0701]KGG31971.1 hypothetical protein EV14_2180 [Prochlorococcus sp. MIT 0703]
MIMESQNCIDISKALINRSSPYLLKRQFIIQTIVKLSWLY